MAGFYLGLRSTGDDLQDLVYFIFGVGLIEETVKALPVLIAVFLWKKDDEPVDILIYASVSALGFACLENAGYFNRVAIGLIMGRTLSAVVMHICLTTLAVYGIFYHRNRKDPLGVLYVLGCFAAAVVLHGLYDFFLSSSLGMGILSTMILVMMMLMFRNMLQNALGQSPFMRSGTASVDLYLYLFYGVLCILSMQFVILDVQYGFDLSLKNLGRNLLNYFFLTFVLISDFGHLEVVKNKWNSLLSNPKKKRN
jgi:RsiW-degrading membrane proteinase PrsW (M82 family)